MFLAKKPKFTNALHHDAELQKTKNKQGTQKHLHENMNKWQPMFNLQNAEFMI